MATYHFTLQISGIDSENGEAEARFYGSGVDDALLYVSDGSLFLAFDREAASEGAAIELATKEVCARGGTVVRIIRESENEPRQATG